MRFIDRIKMESELSEQEKAEKNIPGNEIFSRYILSSRWYRNSDQTIRPDAFIPFPHPDLSVTRHKDVSKARLWELGQTVALKTNKTLHGRTDFEASLCFQKGLDANNDVPPQNHVNISDWPKDKSEQKMIAIEIAKESSRLITLE